jgi:hypothetical protein
LVFWFSFTFTKLQLQQLHYDTGQVNGTVPFYTGDNWTSSFSLLAQLAPSTACPLHPYELGTYFSNPNTAAPARLPSREASQGWTLGERELNGHVTRQRSQPGTATQRVSGWYLENGAVMRPITTHLSQSEQDTGTRHKPATSHQPPCFGGPESAVRVRASSVEPRLLFASAHMPVVSARRRSRAWTACDQAQVEWARELVGQELVAVERWDQSRKARH